MGDEELKPKGGGDMQIGQDVLAVLDGAVVEGNSLKLTCGQLDRKMYVAVNKILEALGGKWNRKTAAHVFPDDPEDRITSVLLTGEVAVPKDFGFFQTPEPLAKRVIDLAYLTPGMSVLEPSAGTGALAALAAEVVGAENVRCVELLPENCARLEGLGFKVYQCDFLSFEPFPAFDRVVMNPPFGKQADIDHVTHAHRFLAPGGRLVAIMAAGVLFRDNRKTKAFRDLVGQNDGEIEQNPDGSFKPSGTSVSTVTVVMGK
jgi:predicted RNA methylase